MAVGVYPLFMSSALVEESTAVVFCCYAENLEASSCDRRENSAPGTTPPGGCACTCAVIHATAALAGTTTCKACCKCENCTCAK